MKKMLIVAYSINDLVLNCFGTIKRYSDSGYKVYAIILEKKDIDDKLKSILPVEELILYNWSKDLIMPSEVELEKLATDIRRIRPNFIVTHDKCENYFNTNHDLCRKALMQGYQIASGAGAFCEGEKVSPRQTPIFGFEPLETNTTFKAGVYLDISNTMAEKIKAIETLNLTDNKKNYYINRDIQRALEAIEFQPNCKYAECFAFFAPIAGHGYFVW